MTKYIAYNNGLRLVVNENISVRSVTFGIWVNAGSAYETVDNNGVSHFIEHMMFKGTKKRSAFQIADELESIGAQSNAFTAKECTCYYTKSVDEHLEKCMEILTDMFYNSTFDETESAREKKVVLEEISMVEDSPEDVCQEMLAKSFYGDSPLGRTILGTEASVTDLTREKISAYMARHYQPKNIVVALAGNVSLELADKLVRKYFDTETVSIADQVVHAPYFEQYGIANTREKKTEQASIAFAFPGVSFDSEESYPMSLVSSCLGGGMSSRLFQEVREKRGLAYSVYTYASAYFNNGVFSVYCGTNPSKSKEAVDTIGAVLKQAAAEGLSEKEFLRGKEQMKGAFILAQENTSSIMNTIGRVMLMTGKVFDLDDRIEQIKRIEKSQCDALLQRLVDFDRVSAAIVSPKADIDLLQLIR